MVAVSFIWTARRPPCFPGTRMRLASMHQQRSCHVPCDRGKMVRRLAPCCLKQCQLFARTIRLPVMCSATPAAAPDQPTAQNPQSGDRYFRSTGDPVPVLGPVEPIVSPGRGRGLGLSHPCEQGDLLFVSLPISMVHASEPREGESGQAGVRGGVSTSGGQDLAGSDSEDDDEAYTDDSYEARLEALVDLMGSQRYTVTQSRWLEALSQSVETAGSTTASTEAPSADSSPATSASRPLPELCANHTKHKDSKTVPLPALLTEDEEKLRLLLGRTTFDAASEDFPLAHAAQEEPRQELLGLWPEYALLNHSCVPSTISYVHNRALITRLTRKNVAKGAELFTNYLGDKVMNPLSVRRQALQDTWGFTCQCPRCKEEAALDKDLVMLVQDVHEAYEDQIQEDLVAAILEEELEDLASLQEQCAAYIEVVGAAMAKKKLTERTKVWLQAGLFGLYEALYHCLEEQDLRDLGLTNKLQELAGAIQPGSELHCYWARTHYDAVQAAADAGQLDRQSFPGPSGRGGRGASGGGASGRGFGGGGRGQAGTPGVPPGITLEAADAACYRAFCARYGPISRDQYDKVLQSHRLMDQGDELDEDEDLE